MVHWKSLSSPQQLVDIVRDSSNQTVLIFKHSTRCSISSIAKLRLEDQWDPSFSSKSDVYLLDVIRDRALSQVVARQFEVHHESPQLLVIKHGECTHEASHFDIDVEEIREVI